MKQSDDVVMLGASHAAVETEAHEAGAFMVVVGDEGGRRPSSVCKSRESSSGEVRLLSCTCTSRYEKDDDDDDDDDEDGNRKCTRREPAGREVIRQSERVNCVTGTSELCEVSVRSL